MKNADLQKNFLEKSASVHWRCRISNRFIQNLAAFQLFVGSAKSRLWENHPEHRHSLLVERIFFRPNL